MCTVYADDNCTHQLHSRISRTLAVIDVTHHSVRRELGSVGRVSILDERRGNMEHSPFGIGLFLFPKEDRRGIICFFFCRRWLVLPHCQLGPVPMPVGCFGCGFVLFPFFFQFCRNFVHTLRYCTGLFTRGHYCYFFFRVYCASDNEGIVFANEQCVDGSISAGWEIS